VSAFSANRAMILDTACDKILGQNPMLLPNNAAICPDGKTANVGSQQPRAAALVVLDLRPDG
jgi:hypothetical protein